jgi:hypothetical protein
MTPIAPPRCSNDAFDASTGVDESKPESVVNLTGKHRAVTFVVGRVLMLAAQWHIRSACTCLQCSLLWGGGGGQAQVIGGLLQPCSVITRDLGLGTAKHGCQVPSTAMLTRLCMFWFVPHSRRQLVPCVWPQHRVLCGWRGPPRPPHLCYRGYPTSSATCILHRMRLCLPRPPFQVGTRTRVLPPVLPHALQQSRHGSPSCAAAVPQQC